MVKVSSLLTSVGIPLVGASVALNFFLYSQVKKYYVELSQVRLDPLGLSYYTQDYKIKAKEDAKAKADMERIREEKVNERNARVEAAKLRLRVEHEMYYPAKQAVLISNVSHLPTLLLLGQTSYEYI